MVRSVWASMRLSGLLRIAEMQSLISPVTKAILVALFIFAILLILYVILWYICTDVDCDHGIWFWRPKLRIRGEVRVTPVSASACPSFTRYLYEIATQQWSEIIICELCIRSFSIIARYCTRSDRCVTLQWLHGSSNRHHLVHYQRKGHALERVFTKKNIWIDALAVCSILVPCTFRER